MAQSHVTESDEIQETTPVPGAPYNHLRQRILDWFDAMEAADEREREREKEFRQEYRLQQVCEGGVRCR